MFAMSHKVENAIVPVAGLGTRMLPATKAIPKEMLPLVDKPLIQFVVDECVLSGIKKIVLVTRASKCSIEDHFDTSFELEVALRNHVDRKQLLEKVQTICPSNVAIMQIRQGLARGLGHAVLCARPLVGNEPVAVILPDIIISSYKSDLRIDNLSAMLKRFSDTGYSQVLVKYVTNVENYGIVNCDEDYQLKPGGNVQIVDFVEKPNLCYHSRFSNLSIVGRYVLSANIWAILEDMVPGTGNEVQLTDALALLMKKEVIEAYYLKGLSYDCGDKLGYMKAFFEHALKHETLGEKFKSWLKSNMD